MSDKRTFKCDYCDDPCVLIMYGMGVPDSEKIRPICCPYDGTNHNKNYWTEVVKK